MGLQEKEKEAKLKEPYDPNDASAKTWFDPTGKTKYAFMDNPAFRPDSEGWKLRDN